MPKTSMYENSDSLLREGNVRTPRNSPWVEAVSADSEAPQVPTQRQLRACVLGPVCTHDHRGNGRLGDGRSAVADKFLNGIASAPAIVFTVLED